MEIITKDEAVSRGAKRYFTGKPCKNGHVAERYLDGRCCECSRLHSIQYNLENRKRINANARKRYEKDKQTILARNRDYRKENAAAFRERDRAKYASNRGRKLLASLIWQRENPIKVSARKNRYRARKHAAAGTYTESDIGHLFVVQNGLCTACGVALIDFHIDHIIPLSLGGDNFPKNLQLLCPSCNCSKGAKHPSEWKGLKNAL